MAASEESGVVEGSMVNVGAMFVNPETRRLGLVGTRRSGKSGGDVWCAGRGCV
jgi:hypothetical protein